jgi:GT2 family glycosyltransferase
MGLSMSIDLNVDPPKRLEIGAWHGHVIFGQWLVSILKPKLLVELGTYKGDSYFSFCQAVKKNGLDTLCHAVDSWEGEPHAGFYGDDVYESVSRYNERYYSSFSALHRCMFDDAISLFADESIDFMHIDGFHTYDAVKHDFEAWRPKLAKNAVVLFHDTAEVQKNFGVWKFWEELEERYQDHHFLFLHSHGLGVLGVGDVYPKQLEALFQADGNQVAMIRDTFSRLNEILIAPVEKRRLATENDQFQVYIDTGSGLSERDKESTNLEAVEGRMKFFLNRYKNVKYIRVDFGRSPKILVLSDLVLTCKNGDTLVPTIKGGTFHERLLIPELKNEQGFSSVFIFTNKNPRLFIDTEPGEYVSLAYRYRILGFEEITSFERNNELTLNVDDLNKQKKLLEETGWAKDEELRTMKGIKTQLEGELEKKLSQISDLEETGRAKDKEILTLKETQTRQEVELEEKLSQLNTLGESSRAKDEELRTMKGIKTQLEVELEEKLSQLNALGESSRAKDEEIRTIKESRALLKENLEEKISQISDIEDKILKKEALIRELKDLQSGLKKSIDDKSQEINGLKESIREKDAILTSKDEEIKKRTDELDTVTQQVKRELSETKNMARRLAQKTRNELVKKYRQRHILRIIKRMCGFFIHPKATLRYRRDKKDLLASGLFDENYYIEDNKDLYFTVANPIRHFLMTGFKKGRNPHPLFDTKYYYEIYPDIKKAGLNPVLHYIRNGWREGRNPHPFFDTKFYLQSYPDVKKAGENPLIHFYRHGAKEGRNPHPNFNIEYYLNTCVDITKAGMDPFQPNLQFGFREAIKVHQKQDAISVDSNEVDLYSNLDRNKKDNSDRFPAVDVVNGDDKKNNLIIDGNKEELYEKIREKVLSRDNVDGFRRKIVFFVSETCEGSYYYRVEILKNNSKRFNVLSNVNFYEQKVLSINDCLEQIMKSDIIIFLRPTLLENLSLLKWLNRKKYKTIIDNDDLFDAIEIGNPSYTKKEKSSINYEFVKHASATINTTIFLKEKMSMYNKESYVFPNCMEIDENSRYIKKNRLTTSTPVRILLAGSVFTRENLFDFFPILKKINNEINAEFVFWGEGVNIRKELNDVGLRNIIFIEKCQFTEYFKTLVMLDIDLCLIPRKENDFNRAKSNCKYLEMAIIKVPVIAQGFSTFDSPYENSIIDGKNGMIAYTEDDWINKIKKVINNNKFRESIIINAYNDIIERYNINTRVYLWDKILSNLLEDSKPYDKKLNYLRVSRVSYSKHINRYYEWIDKVERKKHGKGEERTKIKTLIYRPLISIIMPVYNTNEIYLRKAIFSVINQTYSNWELCIVDDFSDSAIVRDILNEFHLIDTRIKVKYRTKNSGISFATNDAVEMASGEYIAFLDHDDEISQNALYMVVLKLNNKKNIDFVYSDSDKIDEYGIRSDPKFKPDWSPELFLSYSYTTHFRVIRKTLFNELKGFDKNFDGAQDYDFLLRLVEKTNNIVHIPEILYHWRSLPGSVAKSTDEKPLSIERGRLAVQHALERRNIAGKVDQPEFAKMKKVGMYKINFSKNLDYPVTIIIPTKDSVKILDRCIKSIETKTSYRNFEILVICNNCKEKATYDYLEHKNIRYIDIKTEIFNYSYIHNSAMKNINTEMILFLNNDTEVISKTWLEEMIGTLCLDEKIGAVGAKLLYPSNNIQHVGISLGGHGLANHTGKNISSNEIGYLGYYSVVRNCAAVTAACMLTKKSLFNLVGGFDEVLFKASYNDVDYCMKLLDNGYRVVINPYAQLYHYEGVTRGKGVTTVESRNLLEKWDKYIDNDPYYNMNLDKNRTNYEYKI